METALGLKEYEELHTVSRLALFASAAATRAFSDQIIKLIKEKKEEDKKEPEKGK
jgi:mevalonate pyrophosphate decarboxylase